MMIRYNNKVYKSTSVPCDVVTCDGDDYGHYEECEDYEMTSGQTSSEGGSSSSSSVSSSFKSISPIVTATILSSSSSLGAKAMTRDTSIFCIIENSKAPIACRSFERAHSSKNVSVYASIGGLRLVQEGYSEEAEYKFILIIDGREHISWKCFGDFRSLGEACMAYSQQYSCERRPVMKNTVAAWQEVVLNRPWWSKPQVSLNYLLAESRLLENFVKNLLFEVPCVQLLLEFAS
jgi:hypothetical protein